MTDIIHPRENPELFGHEAAEANMLHALSGKKLPNAWLITGPKGIGKATLAYRFARYLLAGEGSAKADDGTGLFGDALPQAPSASLHMDPEHPVFSRVAQGSHADLRVLVPDIDEGKKDIPVDAVRKISQFLSLTPAESQWRIVIIDSADNLNKNAANALLKALEEPPRQAIMLLVSHNPGKLLPTIRSRCRNLNLQPLETDDVDRVLGHILPDAHADGLHFATRMAQGSPGFAAELYAGGGQQVYETLIAMLADMPTLDIPALHKWGDKFSRKEALEEWRLVMFMLSWFLGRVVEEGVEGTLQDELVPGERQVTERLVAQNSMDTLAALWQTITRIITEAEWSNMDRKHTLIELFGKIAKAA